VLPADFVAPLTVYSSNGSGFVCDPFGIDWRSIARFSAISAQNPAILRFSRAGNGLTRGSFRPQYAPTAKTSRFSGPGHADPEPFL